MANQKGHPQAWDLTGEPEEHRQILQTAETFSLTLDTWKNLLRWLGPVVAKLILALLQQAQGGGQAPEPPQPQPEPQPPPDGGGVPIDE
jgi:hypothetical protein